jgi:DNA invertase Pin-like site-specific DNA recombinase
MHYFGGLNPGEDSQPSKARGVYKGRKANIDPAKVRQMKANGIGPSAIAKALKIGRASVYRALAE